MQCCDMLVVSFRTPQLVHLLLEFIVMFFVSKRSLFSKERQTLLRVIMVRPSFFVNGSFVVKMMQTCSEIFF